MKMSKWVALVVAVCLAVPLSVLALPHTTAQAATYPCLFYGTAKVDDEPVAADTEITAWVGSEQVGSTLTGADDLPGNQFSLVVELESPAEVSFKIGELWASETATWVQYGSVEVTLTATSAVVTYPCLFYGTAMVDDEPVAADTEITAWVGSEQVGSTLTGADDLPDNQFSVVVELAAPAEVSFKIGTLDANETATWIQDGSVEVNLTATSAVVTYPCLFYGTAQIDGMPVGAGIAISAWMEDEELASTTTGADGLPPDQYSLPVELAAPAEVSFKIGTLDANETDTWVQYGSVEVNLTASTGVTYPCLFYGTALVDDEPVAADTEITAWVGSEQVGSTLTGADDLPDNQFSLVVELESPAEVSFKIGTLDANETATWVQYGSVEVTLTVTEPEPEPGPSPTYYYIQTNLFDIEKSYRISRTGEILKTIEATSADGNLTITIPKDTIALDRDGKRLKSLEAAVNESPPDPPEDAHIIGLAYDFGPDGATFDPAITLTWSYDPDLPEGVDEEDLVVAYYDEAIGEWVELDGELDTENNTITASVAHLTTFAIIGSVTPLPPVIPAAFETRSLSISPAEVVIGEEVTIAVLVANTGGEAGSYQVTLAINDLVEATKEVTVRAGLSKEVTFSVTREEADSYTVTVDGLSGSFTVVTVVVPPEPAAFSVSSLSVLPAEVEPGETVTIDVAVTNTGGTEGSYTVVLKINGVKEADRTVTVAAGDTLNLIFPVTREEAGIYTVAVDGLSGSFTVVAPPEEEEKPGFNWPLYGGIIGGVIVAGLLIYVFVFRRRAY